MDRFVPATDFEWKQAQALRRSEPRDWDSAFAVNLAKQDKEALYSYKGHFFWGAVESPTRRWVAIRSLDGVLPERLGFTMFVFERSEGDHHLEVFEAATRKRLFRIGGQFCHVTPESIWRTPTGWIDDDLLLVAFNQRQPRSVVLCRVQH